MSQTQEQERTQHSAAPKKKKNTSANADGAGEGPNVAGGDMLASRERRLSEKKPLHASMEQLQMQTKAQSNASRSAAGSNWSNAIGVPPTSGNNSRRNSLVKTHDNKEAVAIGSGDKCESVTGNTENAAPATKTSKSARMRQKRKVAQLKKFVSMDCEMVGVGFNGQDDMLARVSIVNKQGEVLLDKFVKPREPVTDYRTSVSGIRPRDIENGEEFDEVQDEVLQLLQGKILVGHAIRNDLTVLHIKHPFANIRDTSRYKPLCKLVANGHTPSLKRVSQAILNMEIQTGEHNSVEDARAAMNIYNRLSADWEKYIQKHGK